MISPRHSFWHPRSQKALHTFILILVSPIYKLWTWLQRLLTTFSSNSRSRRFIMGLSHTFLDSQTTLGKFDQRNVSKDGPGIRRICCFWSGLGVRGTKWWSMDMKRIAKHQQKNLPRSITSKWSKTLDRLNLRFTSGSRELRVLLKNSEKFESSECLSLLTKWQRLSQVFVQVP